MRIFTTVLIIILISITTACFNNSSNQGFTEEVMDSLEKSEKLYDLYIDSANIQLKKENYAKAIPYIDECIKLKPKWHYLYNLRGCCYMYKNSVNDSLNNIMAIEDFSKAIFYSDNISDYYNNRGWAYQMRLDYQNALYDFKEAVLISPGSVYLHGNVLRVLFITNKNEQALNLANDIIKKFPEAGYAYYIRGHLKRDYLHKYIEGNKDIKISKKLDWRQGIKLIY